MIFDEFDDFEETPTSLQKLNVEILSKENEADTLSLETNEHYFLTVDTISTLRAETVFGALHGIETFSQLIVRSDAVQGPVIEDAPVSFLSFFRF